MTAADPPREDHTAPFRGDSVPSLPGARETLDPASQRTEADAVKVRAMLATFLAEKRPERSLALWLGPPGSAPPLRDAQHLKRLLVCDIARIDELLCAQVDAVLHHPRFQRLEASWRGLLWLTDRAGSYRDGESPPIKIRVLSLSWGELAKDIERAIEFDQSQLFKKIHDAEFGTAGGEPFGIVLADFEVAHRSRPGHPGGDVAVVEGLSRIAAAAFAPVAIGCHPSLFGLDQFRELEHSLDLSRTFDLPEYAKWTALRKSDDARFVSIVLPRVLGRLPWADDGSRADGFRYREDVARPDGSQHLWGTAVYAVGAVVVRAFGESSWPAEIRGLPVEGGAGGVVEALPIPDFETDRAGVAPKLPTDLMVTDRLEQELAELGLMSLCPLHDVRLGAFYSTPSVQLPRKYDTAAATINAKISSMLQYMLCVSRFAHFVKAMGRDKIGSYATAAQCQRDLQDWLLKYTTGDDDASAPTKARYPLRESQVEVREHPGKPGAYFCVVHLKPHYQLDQVAASVRLVTEFAPVRAG